MLSFGHCFYYLQLFSELVLPEWVIIIVLWKMQDFLRHLPPTHPQPLFFFSPGLVLLISGNLSNVWSEHDERWLPEDEPVLSPPPLPGKTYTMIGKDSSTQSLGIVPCAISWLFKLINERKEKTGTRFCVRVSAVEIFGKDEELKDLLSEASTGSLQDGQSPGIHLREDPICGTQVSSVLPLPSVFAPRCFHSPYSSSWSVY